MQRYSKRWQVNVPTTSHVRRYDLTDRHIHKVNYFLNWTEISIPVVINTRQDEEETRARGTSLLESSQPEYDCSFILLNYLDTVAKGEGQSDQDQKDWDGGQEQSSKSGYIFTTRVRHLCNTVLVQNTLKIIYSLEIWKCWHC